MPLDAWPTPDAALLAHLERLSGQSLRAYDANPLLIDEHVNMESDLAQGGYGRRQLFELIQNGADAMVAGASGEIRLVLTETHLYCANVGAPIEDKGLNALLHAYLSVKRGDEIGRFGLGFKSVLGISNKPEFFSRSLSFGFDAERALADIRRRIPDAQAAPVLRTAYPIDIEANRRRDTILDELATWATTVVRLKRDVGSSEWLDEDFRKFPAEFLLFCRHVTTLTLDNHVTRSKREIHVRRDGHRTFLVEGTSEREWVVMHRVHNPSEAAKRDAGSLSARDSVPIAWALPVTGDSGIGKFWAFFPLADETTLSGILNAPWKTNDDRTGLLPGPFNEELIQAGVELIIGNLAQIYRPDDPGWHFDVLPARGREARSWADGVLTKAAYEAAAKACSVPDQLGVLRRPADLHLHPRDIPRVTLELWSAQPHRPQDWCHFSIETRERRPRVERLFEYSRRVATTHQVWLAALATPEDPASYAATIRVAASALDHDETAKSWTDKAWILVDQRGEVHQIAAQSIFIAEPTFSSSVVCVIHPSLRDDESLRKPLKTLGVLDLTPAIELQALLKHGMQRWTEPNWRHCWDLIHAARGEAKSAIDGVQGAREKLRIRTKAGTWALLDACLIPGPIVPADGSRDASVAIDIDSYEPRVLEALGVVARPATGGGRIEGLVFSDYRRKFVAEYFKSLPEWSASPQMDRLAFDRKTFAGPLEPLRFLSDEGLALYSESLLETELRQDDWVLSHQTQPRYPRLSVRNPVLWAIEDRGRLLTSLGPRTVAESVGVSLAEYSDVLPIAGPKASAAFPLPTQFCELNTDHWNACFERLEQLDDDARIGRVYAIASEYAPAPKSIRCRVGYDRVSESPKSVAVVSTSREHEALISIRRQVLLVDDPLTAERLVKAWGLRSGASLVQTQLVTTPAKDPELLLDHFPGLRFVANVEPLHEYTLVACSELTVVTLTEAGKKEDPTHFTVADKTIFWIDTLTDGDLLSAIDRSLQLSLTPENRESVLLQRSEQKILNRLARIRSLEKPGAKLLAAIGRDAIQRHLPVGLVGALKHRTGHDVSDEQVGELASSIYGVDLLHEFRNELAEQSFQPPDRWAGSNRAIAFVRKLGLGPEYAGSENEPRPEVVRIDGPSILPPLHAFQEEIKENVRALIRSKSANRRGLVSLPTGAGKTRVAVSALAEAVVEGELDGPILWIAQTEELCEQAIQAWSEVWRASGPDGRQLRLCRLWGSNDAALFHNEPQVVVATIAKLQNRVKDPNYEWLSQVSCVVVDEAHLATEPSYTSVLAWTGITRTQTRCPLVGLTATAFRGNSEEETRRLVQRFGGERLDKDALGPDPYRQLQRMGVLAQVRHATIDGADIHLSNDEAKELEKLQRLPASATARLTVDAARNDRILSHVLSRPTDWPILVFAASVQHAQILAAMLSSAGVSARPISADTEAGTRRHYIESFRKGSLRVLTNYNVLTAGFDAPAVRAVYVARPTFSPTSYQQMIGRGLRGPKNGGKHECLIVNVADNFARYGTSLAFTEFDYLWSVAD